MLWAHNLIKTEYEHKNIGVVPHSFIPFLVPGDVYFSAGGLLFKNISPSKLGRP